MSETSNHCELLFGDCLLAMHELPAQSVDLVLCDLPYGTTRNRWDTPLDLSRLWTAYRHVCKPGAPVLLFAQTPFDKVLGASNLPELRYEWIWEKTNATGFLNAKRAPLKAHENILVFCDRAPTYRPIKTGGHVRKTSTRLGYSSNYGAQAVSSYDSTERYPRSVLRFASDKQRSKLHPTQKPVALLEYLIRTHAQPGAVVLDNCMGSASTAIAAMQAGCAFIGIENDVEHFETAQRRVRDYRP